MVSQVIPVWKICIILAIDTLYALTGIYLAPLFTTGVYYVPFLETALWILYKTLWELVLCLYPIILYD